MLDIGRLDCSYEVPRSARVESTYSRLDRLARERLIGGLADALGSAANDGDGSVWLIRSLKSDLAIDLSHDDSELVRSWASTMVEGLLAMIARGPDGVDVIRYENRASYVADRAVRIALGEQPIEWRASIESPVPGDTHARGLALVNLLTSEPGIAFSVLKSLAKSGRLELVLESLGDSEAQILLGACTTRSETPARPTAASIEAILAARKQSPSRGGGRWRAALRWAVLAAPADRGAIESDLGAAATTLAAIAEAASGGRLARIGGIRNSENDADLNVARENLTAASGGDVTWQRAVERSVGSAEVTLEITDQANAWMPTRHAGLFLLLQTMAELEVARIIDSAGYPGHQTARALRVLLGMFVTGGGAPAQTFDAGFRLATASDPGDLDTIDELRALDTSARDQETAGRWIARLVERRAISGELVAAELVPRHGSSRALVLRDPETETWIYGAPVRAKTLERQILFAIDSITRASGAAPAWLILGDSLARFDLKQLMDRVGEVVRADTIDVTAPETVMRAVERLRERPRAAAGDLAFMLGDRVSAMTTLDLAWAVVAQGVMRAFARKLPGFGHSGLEHVFRNFLTGDGWIRRPVTSQIDVRLPLVDLHVVLRIAGMGRMTFPSPWETSVAINVELPA